MKKVTLVHPPFDGKFHGMPLGLVYVAMPLRKKGYDVDIIDLHARPLSDREFKQRVAARQPDYVGIASTSPTHLDACDLAKLVKVVGSIPVIKGGTHETYCYDTTLALHPEIDYSVIGPGEETLCELLEALEQGTALTQVAGIAYREGSRIHATERRDLHRNLDLYPHPERSLLEPDKFYDLDIFQGDKTTQIRMSRGCSYGCTFCPIDRTYVFHSADYVMEELREIAGQGYKAIFWDDAIFTAHKNIVTEILSRTISEGLQFRMGAQTRADVHITSDMLSLMKQAGFVYLSVGMESGDPETLATYNKRLNIEDVRHAITLMREHGITSAVTAIIGAPEETFDSVRRTVDVLNAVKPDTVSWSVYSVYPGSYLHFEPLWYEDRALSREVFWKRFDEGYQAKHARDIEHIAAAWQIVQKNMDPGIRR